MYDRQSIDASLQTMVVTIKPVLEALHMENVETVPRVSAIDHEGAIFALLKFGVVVVDGAFEPDAIDLLRQEVTVRHPEFAHPEELTDFQNNGDQRFIAPVSISRRIFESGILGHRSLDAVARGILGEKWVVDACGLTMALPGCQAQKLHRDGESLYPEFPIKKLLPAYALTVMIPLIDVLKDGGTTAFQLGTHSYKAELDQSVPVSTTLARGSFIVWNFEVMHGGEANRSDQPRPMLYMTLCRPFWTDMTNFGGTSRVRLTVDADVIPLLNRRFARAADGGTWAHTGLGEVLQRIDKSSPDGKAAT